MPASITLTVAHLASATSFFLACLQPLGYVYRGRVENTIGFGLPDTAPDFWITQSIPGVPPGPAHVAFPAVTRDIVHRFFLAAIKAGAKCQGEPALRDTQSGYYSAAVIDFDNNSIEAVYREDVMGTNFDATSNAKSVVRMSQKSSTKSKAATAVSSASKAKTATPSEVTRVSHRTNPKTTVSRASKTPPSVASTTTTTTTTSPRPTVSKAPSQAPTQARASGNGAGELIDEAKGALNVARVLVSAVTGDKSKPASADDSHAPSDAIVGTLLGVAAGAALHYAFSSRKKSDGGKSQSDEPHPGITRSETAPSYSQERYRYYHGYDAPEPQLAIADGRSATSRVSRQRMIEMIDNDAARSEYAPSTIRPQRRNSFNGPLPSHVSSTRSRKLLEAPAAPPTSYRAPTQMSQHTSRSRSSSVSRSTSRTSQPSPSLKHDEGYASASETRSHASRRSSIIKQSKSSSRDSSTTHRRRRGSESQSQSPSVITAIRNKTEPLPSRKTTGGTFSDVDNQSFHSTRTSSKSMKNGPSSTNASQQAPLKLTRKQLEKLEDNGRPRGDITRSVVGKVKDVDRLALSSKEVRPEDSVSQVSSNASRRRR